MTLRRQNCLPFLTSAGPQATKIARIDDVEKVHDCVEEVNWMALCSAERLALYARYYCNRDRLLASRIAAFNCRTSAKRCAGQPASSEINNRQPLMLPPGGSNSLCAAQRSPA